MPGTDHLSSLRWPSTSTSWPLIAALVRQPGKAALKSTAHSTLEKIAAAIKKDDSAKTIYVDCHTDSDPITEPKDLIKTLREAVKIVKSGKPALVDVVCQMR